jgi:3-oxoacid CoA-transferase subunit A
LTHTCPKKYEPTEVFDKNIDQTKVDKSMEEFLDVLEESIDYDEWYCGHYHIEKDIDKIKFMHKSIIEFNKKMSKSK